MQTENQVNEERSRTAKNNVSESFQGSGHSLMRTL
jgi:hypothetical protein